MHMTLTLNDLRSGYEQLRIPYVRQEHFKSHIRKVWPYAALVTFTDGEKRWTFRAREQEPDVPPAAAVHRLIVENRLRDLWFIEAVAGPHAGYDNSTSTRVCYFFPKGWCDEKYGPNSNVRGTALTGYGPAYATANSDVAEMSVPLSRIDRMIETDEDHVRKLHPKLITYIEKINADKVGQAVAPYVPPRPLPAEWFSKRGFTLHYQNGFHRRSANVTLGGVKRWLALYVGAETGKVELTGVSASKKTDSMPVRVVMMKTIDHEEDLDQLLVALGFDMDLTGPEAEARREEYRRKKLIETLWDIASNVFDDVTKDEEINAIVIPLGRVVDDIDAVVNLLVFEDGTTGVREDEQGFDSKYTRLLACVRDKDSLLKLADTLKGS